MMPGYGSITFSSRGAEVALSPKNLFDEDINTVLELPNLEKEYSVSEASIIS